MPTPMNPVVHFEMPADDRKRMSDFYTRVFGWNTQQLGPEMGDYVLVATTETDENQMIKKPGVINGGFFQRTKDPAMQVPSVVISVPDIRAHMKKVKEGGGKIVGGQKPNEPDEIPGVGLFISFQDTEGNRVGMMQPTGNKS